ncbi:hypothetical protein IQ06DRAFT_378133 [Phaeosphaeriaceae sp. SRC1lsM3a]|nr:hypothetical protein IQ06DRAFT_378133 [Stagonospora sp. SRC1lsM3a]
MWACIGSVASFMAMTGLLCAFDGKAQPEWPYGATLNSAVSWLSTITKGFLLVPWASCISQSIWISYMSKPQGLERLRIYDEASRGPWGSLELIWTLKARRLVCVGALLSVLAIGIDPTLQQTVVIRTRDIDAKQQATLPRAQSFLEYTYSAEDSRYNKSGSYVPTSAMAGAMYSGLLVDTSDPHTGYARQGVAANCPTGNCTYPLFQSLAVCVKCENITDLVTQICNQSVFKLPDPTGATLQLVSCNYALPNGLAINQTSQLNETAGGPSSGIYRTTIAATAELEPAKLVDSNASFVTMNILRGKSCAPMGKEVGLNMTIRATQCSLSWCVGTYNSSVKRGKLEEDAMRFSTENFEEDPSNEMFGITPSYSIDGGPNARFVINKRSSGSLAAWLQEKLTFSNSKADPDQPDISSNVSSSDTRATGRLSETLTLFQKTDPEYIFTNLAKAMTTYIRSIDASQQEQADTDWPVKNVRPVLGTSTALHVYIAIRWPWLIFTGAILLSTLVFFALVVLQSAKNGVVVWKSSPLALLFHGLQLEDKERCEPMNLAGMEHRAKQIRVQLRDGGSSVKLEECG